MAALSHRDVEDVPIFLVRTPLQQVVQVVKRHRDIYFADNCDDQPTSILLTTLVARAYRGQTELADALLGVVTSLDDTIERRDDGLWVPNPAHNKENFADKWKTSPERRERFVEWNEALVADVTNWWNQAGQGLDAVTASMSKSLGADPVIKAAGGYAQRVRAAAATGAVGVSQSGRLTSATSGATSLSKHTFHGGQPLR